MNSLPSSLDQVNFLKTSHLDMYYLHSFFNGVPVNTRSAMELHCFNYKLCLQSAEIIAIDRDIFAVEASLKKIGWIFIPETGDFICKTCLERIKRHISEKEGAI